MTPAEQIAYLRNWREWSEYNTSARDAVCDLAERALLTDDEAAAVRRAIGADWTGLTWPTVAAVLRRLLPDERDEHRLTVVDWRDRFVMCVCSCGCQCSGGDADSAVRAWAAHAGIGGTG